MPHAQLYFDDRCVKVLDTTQDQISSQLSFIAVGNVVKIHLCVHQQDIILQSTLFIHIKGNAMCSVPHINVCKKEQRTPIANSDDDDTLTSIV